MILGSNGIKMGKRFPEYVVNPSDIVRDYGADTLRLYEMFMGPLEASKPWSNQGVEGAKRFIDRVFRLVTDEQYTKRITKEYDNTLEKVYHQTVKKVTNDFEQLAFNTAISQMMVFVNEAYKAEKIYIGFIEGLVKLLSPVTPHICEEMWELLGHNKTIAFESWPTYDEEKTKDNDVLYVVSINGKVRDKFNISASSSDEEVKAQAFALPRIQELTSGKEIVKVIVVKGKIVNIVIK
jgi:leucyl-tRNA synthetase